MIHTSGDDCRVGQEMPYMETARWAIVILTFTIFRNVEGLGRQDHTTDTQDDTNQNNHRVWKYFEKMAKI